MSAPPRRPAARGTKASERSSAAATITLVLLCVSLISIAWLHVANGSLDPIIHPISFYVLVAGGPTLLLVAAASAAVGTTLLLLGLITFGVRCGPVAQFLVYLWIFALLLVTAFPMDSPGPGSPLSGQLHNWGGLLLFSSLPLGCWQVAGTFAGTPGWQDLSSVIRYLSGATGAALIAFLALHPPIAGMRHSLVSLPGGIQVHGLIERILLSLEVTQLLVMARRLRHLARTSKAQQPRGMGEVAAQ